MKKLFTVLLTATIAVSIFGQKVNNQIELIKLKMTKETVIKILGQPSFINTYSEDGTWTKGTKEIWLYGAECQECYAKYGSIYFDSLSLVQYVYDNKVVNDGIKGSPDTSKYILSIKPGIIEKRDNQTYLIVSTTLTNNTNDTLKYLSMSCSWREFYYVDNDNISVEQIGCNRNGQVMLTLPPHRSIDRSIKLIIGKTTDISKLKFKLGFSLLIVKNNLLHDFNEQEKIKNIIWSNTIIQTDITTKEN